MHLMQGPITVFEGSNYAGDARILDLQPNEERLLSYAIDLGTEVKPVPSSDNGRLTAVKAVKGVVYTTTKVRETKTYTIANRNDAERTVLIEHPVRNDFKLVDTDKPAETAVGLLPLPGQGAGRQDRQAGRHRGTRHQQQRAAHQPGRQQHPLLHQPDRDQPEGQAGAGKCPEAAPALAQDAAGDPGTGAAAARSSPTTRRGCGPT